VSARAVGVVVVVVVVVRGRQGADFKGERESGKQHNPRALPRALAAD
jgi:hypothetical protein